MWFFDDAFTTPTTDSSAQWGSSTQWADSTQTNEVLAAAPLVAVTDTTVDSQMVAQPAADVVFEAPIFSTGSNANTIVQEETPTILSQEVIPDASIVEAAPIAEVVFSPTIETPSPETFAVFEPITATPVVEQEVIPTPAIGTPIPVAEINIAPVEEIQVESPLNVRNPEDILDDTERLLRQSEEALEKQAKILEWEAAAHQATSNIEKEAADSALQAAQSAHAKADKLEATIASIQKEKEKLSVSA